MIKYILAVVAMIMVLPCNTAHAESPNILFASGFEADHPGLDFPLHQKIAHSQLVTAYGAGPVPECGRVQHELAHHGEWSLLMAGTSLGGHAFVYCKLFDLNITVTPQTKLSYWMYHAEGLPQVSIDGRFNDGTEFRDLQVDGQALTDQQQQRLHPVARQTAPGTWHYVNVDMTIAAGKTIEFIMIGFDAGASGFQGRYRSYLDDFMIYEEE